MFSPTVFLINGFAQAGKDTLADCIIALLGSSNCIKMSFADPLKSVASDAMRQLGHPKVDFKEEKWKKKHRKVLVALAEAAREENPDTFALLLAEGASNAIYGAKKCVVVSDWRYLNELRVIEGWPSCSLVTIRIKREGVGAANESERLSIIEIEKTVRYDFEKTILDGDIVEISKFAKDIVSNTTSKVGELGVSNSRFEELKSSKKPVLSKEEMLNGWHYCKDNNGDAVHPAMESYESCYCKSKAKGRGRKKKPL